jgi:hypothetical protein
MFLRKPGQRCLAIDPQVSMFPNMGMFRNPLDAATVPDRNMGYSFPTILRLLACHRLQ